MIIILSLKRSYGLVFKEFYIKNVNKETIKDKFHNDVFKTLKRYQKIFIFTISIIVIC